MENKSNFRSFLDWIVSPLQAQTTEKKLYLGTVLIMLFALFPMMIWNYYIGLERWVNYIILFFAVPCLILFYFLARYKNKYRVGYITVAFIIFLSTVWVANGGVNGTSPVLFLVAIIVTVGISKPKHHYIFILIFFLHLLTMLVLDEYVIHDMIIPYPNKHSYYQDLIFTYAISMLIVFWILRFYKLAYIKENDKLTRQKEELEKNISVKNMYFTIMVHDLKSSFSNILGFTDIMTTTSDQPMTNEQYKRFAQLTQLSANRSFELLEDILEWSRIQQDIFKLNSEKIKLSSSLLNVLNICSVSLNQKNITLNNEIDTNTYVTSDVYYLETILRNLITNAIKYTPIGGKITLSTYDYSADEIAISVCDTGIGMDENWVENLFNFDFNSKRPGTEGETSNGIGLKICKELTLKQGSQIFATSEPGKGSTFTFTVPR